MASPHPPPVDSSSSSSSSLHLSIYHKQSNSKFTVRCTNPDLLVKGGVKKFLRAVVPKIKSGSGINACISAAMLSYQDDEGDVIAVRTDADLQEAIRLASTRHLLISIQFDENEQSSLSIESSSGACPGILFDSCSDAHIECEHAAPDLPTGNASPTAELLRSCVATEQRGTNTLPFQSSVDDIKMRILPVEQALQQLRLVFFEAVEDINLAHAQDRAQFNQASRVCSAAIDEVRHSIVAASARLEQLEAAQLEFKSTTTSVQDAVTACMSDAGVRIAAIEDLKRHVSQLQQIADCGGLMARDQLQQHVNLENMLNELKSRCQLLEQQVDGLQQQQFRYALLENLQNLISDRLSAVETAQLQIQQCQTALQQKFDHQLELQQYQRQHCPHIDEQLEAKFAALQQRISQLESDRESWTTIEKLVMSSGNGIGNQTSRSQCAIGDVPSNFRDSGFDEICSSYVALQPPPASAVAREDSSRLLLQLSAVSVHFRSEQTPRPLELLPRAESMCPSDPEFFVSFDVHLLQLVDLLVEFKNASDCIAPEDVELRLISQSKGVTKAAASMHKVVRTKKPMQPKETFTFVVCCTAPGMLSSFPARYVWQPFSAGAPIGSSLAVYLSSSQ